jgi:hypothetical protein
MLISHGLQNQSLLCLLLRNYEDLLRMNELGQLQLHQGNRSLVSYLFGAVKKSYNKEY